MWINKEYEYEVFNFENNESFSSIQSQNLDLDNSNKFNSRYEDEKIK